jgi:integrase
MRGQIWWAAFQKNGKRVVESTGTSNEAEARKILTELIAQHTTGTYIPVRKAPTFETIWELIVHDYRANARGERALHARYTHLEPFFRFCVAVDIDSVAIGKYVDARLAEGAARATINRELAALARALRLAINNRMINAMPYVQKLREDNTRRNWFTPVQANAVEAELPDYLKCVARAGYITGWRTNELLSRQWRHVDFEGQRLRLEPGETKNGEGRMFSLVHGGLRTVLETQREYVNEIEHRLGVIVPWVFCHRDGSPIRNFYYVWRKACDAGGIVGYRFHDFRRVAVRNLDAVVARSVAMAMVGHKTEAVFRRYAIVDEQDVHVAASKLEALHTREEAQAAKVVPLKRATGSK